MRADDKPGRSHGGVIDDELVALGLSSEQVIDFSASCNPFGPSPALGRALATARIDRYPDLHALAARRALAEQLELDVERIVLGNGAAELLWTLARALLTPVRGARRIIVVAEPTFSELPLAARRIDTRIERVRGCEQQCFALDLERIFATADVQAAHAVYLCAPSSPVGAAVDLRALGGHARARPLLHVIVDESYLSLSERFADTRLQLPPNVIRVRSLTKEQGIPGVRVGYAIVPAGLAGALDDERAAWTTGAHAQAAAIAACASEAFVAESRARLLELRLRLAQGLCRLGLAPLPSSANFVCVRVGDAARLRRRLLAQHRVLVRDCSSFGMPAFIRIAVRPAPELERLLGALALEFPRCSPEL